MLAVIGPRWAALNEGGQSRLADETDWIRIEIEAALAKDIPVIPVLVNGAAMPNTRDLPRTMEDLAFRQAAPLDMRRDFHTHMDRLIGVMDQLLAPKAAAEPGAGPEQGQRYEARVAPQPQPPKVAEATNKPAARDALATEPKIDQGAVRLQPNTALGNAPKVDGPSTLRLLAPDAARRDAQSAVLAGNWWMVAVRGVLAVALGVLWLPIDKGYFSDVGASTAQLLPQLYLNGLLIFLLLDGALAIASGWRGARPGGHFVMVILNGVAELLLAGWVAMERSGLVRVAELLRVAQNAESPAEAAAPVEPVAASPAWPPTEFWVDVSLGLLVAGILLLAASAGLNGRYGRSWLAFAGAAWTGFAVFVYTSSSSGELAWVSDILAITAGVALFALALQLLARDKEHVHSSAGRP
jgi:hypothetical protein